MIFPSVGGYMSKKPKAIILLNFFSDYSYGRYKISLVPTYILPTKERTLLGKL